MPPKRTNAIWSPRCLPRGAQALLARPALHAGERVLEVTCGIGIVARLAAPRVGPSGAVLGVALNAAMLETARAQTPTAGAPGEWREGDAHGLPCADATFDVVCCQSAGRPVFSRPGAGPPGDASRHGPGGRLALSVWRSLP
jgi:ubiquinone/menaquinone biosynthesis C-methylase UbiE